MKVLLFKQKNGCNPCKTLTQFLQNDLNVDVESQLDVFYLDGGDATHIDTAVEYGVMSTPVTILLDDEGKEVQRAIGDNRPQVAEILKKAQVI